MSDNYISSHALERFKQRYQGEMPSIEYLLETGIKQVAYNLKGHIVVNPNKGIYRCTYEGQIIEYVVAKQQSGTKVVCTFNNPPKTMNDKCYSYNRKGE